MRHQSGRTIAAWIMAATLLGAGCRENPAASDDPPVSGTIGPGMIYVNEVSISNEPFPGHILRLTPDSLLVGSVDGYLATEPRNGWMLFTPFGENAFYLARTDSTRVVRIAGYDELDFEGSPSVSHDGSVAFLVVDRTASRETASVVVVGSDGANRRVVASDASPRAHLSFSPDGRRLAFAGADDRLHVVDLTTGARWSPGFMGEPGNSAVNRYASMLSWSPDNRSIAFSRRGIGVMIFDAERRDSSLPARIGMKGDNPTWSPDGTTLAVLVAGDIVTMRGDSSAQRVYSLTGTWNMAWTGGFRGAEWSPDGTRLLFDTISGETCILDLASGSVRRFLRLAHAYWSDR